MPRVSDILPLLNARTAAKFGTVSKNVRNAARVRMTSPRAIHKKAIHQSATIGRARYKSSKKSENLNKIYNSLNRVGMANRVRDYNINKFINIYKESLNVYLTGKEHERIIRKMKKWKTELANEIEKRNIQRHKLRMANLFNMSSQGSTPNYNW
jgi:hypothetical protein